MSPSPSAQYSLTIRVEIADRPGMLGLVASAIGEVGASIGSIDLVEVKEDVLLRDITVDATGAEHWDEIVGALAALDGVTVVDTTDRTFLLHIGGKIEQHNKSPLKTRADLSMAYTPGVARVCMAIHDDPDKAFQYTIKRNTVAVVSDGTAVLGLGDIGPRAAMPVMEGKAMLFKEFANVDAFPICLDTKDPDEIVAAVKQIAPDLRRDQLGGHLRPALLRDRGPAEGRARHPRLPRRPARHRDRHARRADQRLQADRQEPGRPARAGDRPGRRRRRGHQDPAWRRASATSSAPTRAACCRPTAATTRTARCRRSSAGTPRRPTPTASAARPRRSSTAWT